MPAVVPPEVVPTLPAGAEETSGGVAAPSSTQPDEVRPTPHTGILGSLAGLSEDTDVDGALFEATSRLLVELEGGGPRLSATQEPPSRHMLPAHQQPQQQPVTATSAAEAGPSNSPPWLWLLLAGSLGLGAVVHGIHWLVHRHAVAEADAQPSQFVVEAVLKAGKESRSVEAVAVLEHQAASASEGGGAATPDTDSVAAAAAAGAAIVRPLRDARRGPSEDPEAVTEWAVPPVDASVRARDISKKGWAPLPRGRRSTFTNPLYSAQALNGPDSASAAEPELPGGKASKHLLLARKETAGSDFKLGSMVARNPSPDEPPQPPQQQAIEQLASAGSSSTAMPGRKLTGAKSIAPHDVWALDGRGSVDSGEVQEASTASDSSASSPVAGQATSRAKAAVEELLRRPCLQAEQQQQRNPPPQLLTAQQFAAQVQLGRVLGAGGAGAVHAAVWQGQQVAVKCLHPSLQLDARTRQSFDRWVEQQFEVS